MTNFERKEFYGRRKGRPITKTQQNLYDNFLPEITVNIDDLALNKDRETWVEIGFGRGEHLAWQAENNRQVNFIGAEPFINGIAALLSKISDHKLTNIRIFPDDARLLLKALPDASINKLFILFPDPWSKKRHHKRRIISKETLVHFARILQPGGELRIASDAPDYVEWIIDLLSDCKVFTRIEEHGIESPKTRYEQKGLKAGRKGIYLKYIKDDNF
jgi:tRNA (guanine-N7-)-methyltransferase